MKIKLFIGTLTAVLLLTGCMGTKTSDEGRQTNDRTPLENTRYQEGANQNRNMTNNVNNRNTERNGERSQDDNHYEVSREAADRIVTEITEIDSAYVLTSNRNAYVAAELDNQGENGAKNDRNNSATSENIGNDVTKDNRNNDGNGINRGQNRDNNDRTREEGHEVTDDVKEQIIEIVQSVDPDIDNVYVTTSPDFIDLVNNYADDLDEGRPVRGFFDQVGNMIERVFPQNHR